MQTCRSWRTVSTEHAKAIWTTAISAFFHYGPANGSSHWHFIWSPSLFCGWTTNLEWTTTWVTTVQHTSVFQVSLEDILLPPSHGQLAPHSQVAPPIAFLWRSLRALNKFMTDTDDTEYSPTHSHVQQRSTPTGVIHNLFIYFIFIYYTVYIAR